MGDEWWEKGIERKEVGKLFKEVLLEYTMSKENFKKIFERLPIAERKMPAVIVDGKVFTWEEAWLEIRDDKPLAKKIQDKIEEITKNEK